jgi:hypothetical protein
MKNEIKRDQKPTVQYRTTVRTKLMSMHDMVCIAQPDAADVAGEESYRLLAWVEQEAENKEDNFLAKQFQRAGGGEDWKNRLDNE